VSGVPGLKIPHSKLDPNEQEEGGDLLAEREIKPLIDLPNSAFVWIDECQRVFPPRPSSKTPPPNVRYFEVHRKLGHDGILCTQHPNLLDPNVRKLVGRHIHVVRTLGLQRATIYEWNKCKDPDSKADLKLAMTSSYSYPQKLYPLYKSANIHTIKARIPKLVFIIPLMLIGAVCAAYFGVTYLKTNTLALGGQSSSAPQKSGSAFTPSTPSPPPHDGKASYLDPIADAKQFVFDRTPRVPGLPHTSPRYDAITAPVTAPVPAACVSSSTRCSCYTQQATIMDTPEAMCREIANRGYFQDFNDGAHQENRNIVNERHDIQPMPAISHKEVPASSSRLDNSVGYGVLGSRRDGVRQPGA
jgi:zona occludens toxin